MVKYKSMNQSGFEITRVISFNVISGSSKSLETHGLANSFRVHPRGNTTTLHNTITAIMSHRNINLKHGKSIRIF